MSEGATYEEMGYDRAKLHTLPSQSMDIWGEQSYRRKSKPKAKTKALLKLKGSK